MRKEFWKQTSRGRPRDSYSYRDIRSLEYLGIIAFRFKFDLREFLQCIMEAYDQEESEIRQLSVTCRQRTKDSGVFLFTVEQDVIAQFLLSTRVFQAEKQLESYVRSISAKKPPVRKVTKPKIEDLEAGMKNIDLKARVLDIPRPNRVYTRLGTEAHVTNALIADETGTIVMSLWNEQIGTVSKHDVIEIENGKVANYRGKLQLRIGRTGSLSVIKRNSSKIS
jgi:replication factor A1